MQCMMLKEIYQFIPEQGECSQAAYNCRPCAFLHQLWKKIHTLNFSLSKGINVPVFRSTETYIINLEEFWKNLILFFQI